MELLVNFVSTLTWVLSIAIVGRAVLSWFNLGEDHPLVVIVVRITEPMLGPIRRLLPSSGALDFSPIAALVVLFFVQFIIGKVAG